MHTLKDLVLKIAAILILAAAIGYSLAPVIAPWVMAFSVAAFSIVILRSPYPGKSIRGKRLHGFQLLACACFAASTYLMFRQNNAWVLALIVGAVFLFYGTAVMARVMADESDNETGYSEKTKL